MLSWGRKAIMYSTCNWARLLPRGSYPTPFLGTYFSIEQILTKELGALKQG